MAKSEKIHKAEIAVADGEIKIGDINIPCAVLPDGTRLLSIRAITQTFGGRPGGRQWLQKKALADDVNLPVYLLAKNIKPFITEELALTSTQVIPYRPSQAGAIGHGVDATILPQLCELWLKARDAKVLFGKQLDIANKADIMMRGLAHVGIIALVDEATGYQEVRARNALGAILEQFISKELGKWAKRFPDEFYAEMFRLRGWSYVPFSIKRPALIGKDTKDLVYKRLAPGIIEELERKNPKTESGRRKHHHHRWLTPDIGHTKLEAHITGVMALMKISPTWRVFIARINRVYPRLNETISMFFPDEFSSEETEE